MECKMNFVMHPSVRKIAEHLQHTLPTDELRGVAEALHIIAPATWGTIQKMLFCQHL